jgi:ADP-heptose:LPS heptosyltransferase
MALRRNILLFHQGALGDFLVTWPLALGLGRVLAQSRIFYVTGGQKGALAERALRVESVDVEGGWHQLYSDEPKLPEAAARLLNGAQWIVGFGAEQRDLWARNVKILAPEANVITLSTTPPSEFKGHITEFIIGQLGPWPVMATAMEQMLKSVASRGISGNGAALGGPVVVHPGAGSGKKCWPAEKYLEFADELARMGRHVEVILGEVEHERWPREQIESFGRKAQIVQPATLVELMETLAKASAFIGNDSGPGHLAAMLGIPTYSIFGPNDPTRWRPMGPEVTIVSGQWDAITPAQVMKLLAS